MILAVVVAALGAHPPDLRANLRIVPTYDASITTDPNAPAIIANLNSVCALYEERFSDDITVHITFKNDPSGGASNTPSRIAVPYATYRAALLADVTTADDATALAHLPAQATDPASGSANIFLTRPDARALGLAADAAVDDVILLGCDDSFFDHADPQPGKYDLFSTACHELDEGLGTFSGVGGTAFASDMFRYDGAGNRSFTTNTAGHAWFSIDGTTNIVEYNQYLHGVGDWGDWVHHGAHPQVQDFVGGSGYAVDMGPSEYRLLDAIGYNFVADVPEPAATGLLAGAVLLLHGRRRRKGIAS